MSTVEAAIHAFEQGWAPIPIKQGSKRPAHSNWNSTRYSTVDEITAAFEDSNLGVLLGDNSNGLIDVDLDAPEARTLASGFLPITRMVHGRPSSPKSHYWYQVSELVKTQAFKDPVRAKTDPGRATLIEIRGTGGQTVLPPSVHPNGEQYRWEGGEWHPPAVIPYSELMKQVRWLAAASLLARYWPGEGHRHDASMALAGGLLNLNDPELSKYAEPFVASVALAGNDEEGMDRQDDVASTRALLKRGKKVKGWPSLAKIMDPVVVRQVAKWLTQKDEDEEGDTEGKMKRELVSPFMVGDIPPTPMIVPDIVYEGKVTWLQGEPGGGKTIFALWLALQAMRQGHNVMMIDEESGPRMIGERLAGLGATPEITNEKFWYYPFAAINVLEVEHRKNFNMALSESNPSMIIFDSVADILAQAQLKENDNDDITRLIKAFADPLKTQNVSCLFIDHMTKGSLDGGWARGAGQKKSKTDASWTFTANRAFDKNTMGRITIKRAKDRLGQLPASILFDMGGDGQGNIIIKNTEVVRELKLPEDVMSKRIIQYLKEHAPTEDEGLTSTELAQVIKGNTNKVYNAMRYLEENIEETPLDIAKHGRSKVWFYAGDLEIDFTEDDPK